jgi:sugar phosphate isomerase/epimerase
MMNRREFLGTAAATVLFSRLAAFAADEHKLGAIGLQLYTVRDQMAKDFEGTIAKVAATGYKETEFAGYFKRTPQQVKAALERNGLTAPSAHIPVEDLRAKLPEVIEAARVIGHQYIVNPWINEEDRGSLDKWKKMAEFFNETGRKVKEAGLQFAHHNHDFEFKPTDGQVPYDLLLKETDPNLVKLEMDLYWITAAGQDPLKYFNEYPGRFPMLHVKDRPVKLPHPIYVTENAKFAPVGTGVVDFKRVFAHADKGGVKHYFVEQDYSQGSPFDAIKTSYNNLRKMRF